jgi:hypothetical protein
MDGSKDAQPSIEAKEDADESAKVDEEDEFLVELVGRLIPLPPLRLFI